MSEQQQAHDNQHENRCIVAAGTLSDFVDAISAAVAASPESTGAEAKIHWTDDGLSSMAVDPANVTIVDARLSPEMAESFDSSDDETVIGINLDRLSDTLGLIGADELVTMSIDLETRMLLLSTAGSEFELATINPDSVRKEPDMPDLEFAVDIEADASWLRRARDGCAMVGGETSSVVFEPTDDELVIVGEGDLDEARFALDSDDLASVTRLDDVRSLYSALYLKSLLASLSETVSIRIAGSEMPMCIDSEESFGDLTYLIAPRIERR